MYPCMWVWKMQPFHWTDAALSQGSQPAQQNRLGCRPTPPLTGYPRSAQPCTETLGEVKGWKPLEEGCSSSVNFTCHLFLRMMRTRWRLWGIWVMPWACENSTGQILLPRVQAVLDHFLTGSSVLLNNCMLPPQPGCKFPERWESQHFLLTFLIAQAHC